MSCPATLATHRTLPLLLCADLLFNLHILRIIGLAISFVAAVGPLHASSVGGSGPSHSVVWSTFTPPPYSASFYLAPTGSENNVSNNCTFTLPCQSITGIQSLLTGTSTVLLRGGLYYLNSPIAPTVNGSSSSARITYAAYPGESPIITGAQPLTGWTDTSANCDGVDVSPYKCWMTTISNMHDFEYLIYVPAGWPPSYVPFVMGRRSQSIKSLTAYNLNAASCTPVADCIQVNATDVSTMCPPPPTACMPHNSSDIKFYNFIGEYADILRIASVDSTHPPLEKFTFTNSTPLNGPVPGGRYVIVNSREYFLANAAVGNGGGTFYIDCGTNPCVTGASGVQPFTISGTIYYISNPDEDPTSDLILAPQTQQLVLASGASMPSYGNLLFQGLVFAGDNTVVPAQSYISYQSQPNIPAALSFVDTQNVTIDSSIIAHTSGLGLEFTNDVYYKSGQYPDVYPASMAQCPPGGPPFLCPVTAASTGNQLTNSAIYDVGATALRLGRIPPNNGYTDCIAGGCVGVGKPDNLATSNTTVQNNIFQATGRIYPDGEDGCISINSAHDNTIKDNDCGDSYGGGISVGPGPPFLQAFVHGNTIEFNNIHDIGRGVIADFGCVYIANIGCAGIGGNCGDTFQNNICHDVTHAFSDANNPDGGNGIYLEHNSQCVLAQYNLVYRTSGALTFNNRGENCVSSAVSCNNGISTGGCNRLVNNNIFAHSYQAPIKNGASDTYLDFTFTNNLVYFDNYASPLWNPNGDSRNPAGQSFWKCTAFPCTNYFDFESNDYWNPNLNPGNLVFYTGVSPSVTPWGFTTSAPGWQAPSGAGTGNPQEDINTSQSAYEDPGFVNPNYPAEDYHTPNLPSGIGFNPTPFESTYKAGRTDPRIFPQATAPGLPVQVLSPYQF